MPDLKFDCFIFDKDNEPHYLWEIEDDDVYYSKFAEHMLCPLCEKAFIIRSHSATGKTFLKTSPNSKHGLVDGKPCYYSQPPAPQYAIREFLGSLRGANRLNIKIRSLIRMMKSKDLKPKGKPSETSLSEILSLKYSSKKAKAEKRAVIPKYSINQWSYVPEGEIIAVYGKVAIKVKAYPSVKNPEKENLYWRLHNIKTGAFITSVWANYYPTAISDGNYYFAAFCTKERNGEYYNLKPFDFAEGMVAEQIND